MVPVGIGALRRTAKMLTGSSGSQASDRGPELEGDMRMDFSFFIYNKISFFKSGAICFYWPRYHLTCLLEYTMHT